MNDQQNTLKEKGIFLYEVKGDLDRAGNYFLEWLNNGEGGVSFEQLNDCFTQLFIKNEGLSDIITLENQEAYVAKTEAFHNKILPHLLRIKEDRTDILFVQFPWLNKSKDKSLGLKLSIDDICNDDHQFFQKKLEYALIKICIEDTIKKVSKNNKCHNLKNFNTAPYLRASILDVLMGNSVES